MDMFQQFLPSDRFGGRHHRMNFVFFAFLVLLVSGYAPAKADETSAYDEVTIPQPQSGAEQETDGEGETNGERQVEDRPEPVAFSPTSMSLQAVGATAGIVGVVGIGFGLLGLAYFPMPQTLAEILTWSSLGPFVFAPVVGSGAGVLWVGERHYGRSSESSIGTALGAGLGWLAGLYGATSWVAEDDLFRLFYGKYLAASGGSAMLGAVIGFHIGELLRTDSSNEKSSSALELGIRRGADEYGNESGVLLNLQGRF